MSERARTAAVLRQPALAEAVRVPGRPLPNAPVDGRERSGNVVAPGADTAAASFDAASLEAEIERRAALLAESMIERQRNAWLAQASEEGYTHGVQSGREVVEREWAALAAKAQPLLEGIKNSSARSTQASAELALHLTFAALRKLLGEAFASAAGAQAAIANALDQVDVQSVIVVRVAPKDAVLLAGTPQGRGLFGELPSDVTIESDDRVAPGGCVIETRRGALDARIDAQLERLLEAVREAYDTRPAPPGPQEPQEEKA